MERESSGAGTAAEGFDAVLERLRGVVDRLETGSLTLEESLKVFEEGVRLSRRGAQILETAEKRVEVLLQSEDGSPTTAPFGDDAEKPGDDPGTTGRHRDR
ncbi:MAG: exodeoxyribonuclease VII small subunit [Deltaproteobacteria bacterium]|nr:exodeoxyribonuclease VII small subunit [Deltaproteobacteria bacterium]